MLESARVDRNAVPGGLTRPALRAGLTKASDMVALYMAESETPAPHKLWRARRCSFGVGVVLGCARFRGLQGSDSMPSPSDSLCIG